MSITLKSLPRPILHISPNVIGVRYLQMNSNSLLKPLMVPTLRNRILNPTWIIARNLSYSRHHLLKHTNIFLQKKNIKNNNILSKSDKRHLKFTKIKSNDIGAIVSGKALMKQNNDQTNILKDKNGTININDNKNMKLTLPLTTTSTLKSSNIDIEDKISISSNPSINSPLMKDSGKPLVNENIKAEASPKFETNITIGAESVIQRSFFQRIKENIKWFLIRNKKRPFSKDEIGTLFSWLFISQIIWLVLKTTTVVSLLLLTFNTVFAKELVAQFIGKLINYFSEDISIRFQDALIPEWKSGFIKFKDVHLDTNKNQKNDILEFHLIFHEIEINLSLRKWLQGKGLINDIKVFGIRGETIINYKENKKIENSQELLLDWFTNPNYKLMNVNLSDCKFNVIENFADKLEPKSIKIRIFNLDISGLRFNQLLTDFLKANVITGSINNSLFTFHKRQHKLSYMDDMKDDLSSWDRITRLRLNSINVNTLGLNKTKSFNWIEDGDVGLVADIMLPQDTEDSELQDNDKYLLLDLTFKFKDLKASLPKVAPILSTGEQIISLDELKPVISFVNLQRILSRSSNYSSNEINNILDDENDEHPFSHSTPNVSIKRKRSYPNITVIQSDKKKSNGDNDTDTSDKANNGTSIIKFHPTHDNNQPYNTGNFYNSSSLGSSNRNELVLHCRLVKNIKDLEKVILFQETGVYDQICMELYVDLIKTVEEWEIKNKDEWMKEWGTTFASQLLLFGFTNVM
ncbi:similar to Kazachstania africana KAFR_0E02490 hypothetical protein [Maudiozyma saulgeensis]|uniref:Mitochondrial distribution and morphology protein 32 n=1 Tax=Maudiozyma saulgeensis TaxID=1789683 RepID=A0A1X7QY83_9SACH|nr:similar to Kazachstania africana KAFR_0E02490 hypothetical protein [Kazachstania saulgeensis]